MKKTTKRSMMVFLLGILPFLGGGCSTTTEFAPPTKKEKEHRESQFGFLLAQRFQTELTIKKDVEIGVFIRAIAERLVATNGRLNQSPVAVSLIQDRDTRWRNYSFPGIQLYLSTGLLKNVQYENEMAAVIAFELAHLGEKHLLNHFYAQHQIEADTPVRLDVMEKLFPSPYGELGGFTGASGTREYFDFTLKENLQAIQVATNMLYQAGFDPRGFLSVWRWYQESEGHSPFSDEMLKIFIAETYQAIAKTTPLRNPIVKTEAFASIQKRIQSL